jgi:hypothetical protein
MLRPLVNAVSRLFCHHKYRPSRTWPGVKVCEKCGYRKPGDI